MNQQSPFTWHHFEAEIMLLCVRWYLRYSLSYRDLEEMMRERGCTLITPRSLDGFSTLLQNWSSAVGLISGPLLTPGAWMRPL